MPNGAENSEVPPQEVHKVARGPLQPRPTHTPSRRCAPCSLACFHLFFRELLLLTRPRPAQPLLITGDSAGNSVFLSPIGVTISAARPCMFIECVSAKNRRVRLVLVPGLMPAHADPCGDHVSFTGRQELILRCATSAALPLKARLAACTSLTASHVSSAIRRPDVCFVVLYHNMTCFKFTHRSE